jgi:hypothetical protein
MGLFIGDGDVGSNVATETDAAADVALTSHNIPTATTCSQMTPIKHDVVMASAMTANNDVTSA